MQTEEAFQSRSAIGTNMLFAPCSFCVVLLLFLVLVFSCRKPHKFPPGPIWFPCVGILFQLPGLRRSHEFFHLIWYHLYKVYGSVVGIAIGNQRIVIVSGREAIREFYSNDAMNGRPNGFFYCIRTFNKRLGVVFTDGDAWNVQRNFSAKILRQMGMGRSNMVQQIEHESHQMIEYFRRKCDGERIISMQHAFDIPVMNTLWVLIAGYRFEYDDERLLRLCHLIHKCFQVIDMTGGVLNLIPSIRYVAPSRSGYRPLLDAHRPLWQFLRQTIAEKRQQSGDESNSFVQLYLSELDKKGVGNASVHASFSDEQLLSICLDFFQAGTETTSNTLSFGLMYMMHNERVRRKVHAELDRVIGAGQRPALSDRSRLPYVEATLSEIIRFANVAPLAIAHRSMANCQLQQYNIPKDTLVLVSLYSLNMDEEYWSDPHAFRPERFLDENGQYTAHAEQFFPFGLGKRRCMGENLARNSLFLFFAAFMHAFEIGVPHGLPLPNIRPNDGITLQPKPFKIQLTPRF